MVCFLTIIGALLFRRRLAPLLIASGVLMALGPLSLIVPVLVVRGSLNKLSGAIFVMTLLPISGMLLFLGIGCFLFWIGRTTYRAFRN